MVIIIVIVIVVVMVVVVAVAHRTGGGAVISELRVYETILLMRSLVGAFCRNPRCARG